MYRCTGVQVLCGGLLEQVWCTGLLVYRCSVQVYWCTGVVWRCTCVLVLCGGLLVYWCCVEVYWWTGVVWRFAGVQVLCTGLLVYRCCVQVYLCTGVVWRFTCVQNLNCAGKLVYNCWTVQVNWCTTVELCRYTGVQMYTEKVYKCKKYYTKQVYSTYRRVILAIYLYTNVLLCRYTVVKVL